MEERARLFVFFSVVHVLLVGWICFYLFSWKRSLISQN